MARQQRHLGHQQEEAGLFFRLLEDIKGCSNPKASPAGTKRSSFTQQQLCHGTQIPPCAGEAARSHAFPGTAPRALPGAPFDRSLWQDRLPSGRRAHTGTHVGRPDQSVRGELGDIRSNISTVNLWKTGVERMKPQREPGIL